MKEKLTHNLGMKILSIVFAALVWLTIMNIADPIVTTTIEDIPVHVINDEVITSRGYQYEIESGSKVDVRVKGKRSVIDNLTASDFVATADFNSLNSMYMAAITVECISDEASDLVITLKTETMAVKLEDQETQPYSVRVNLIGEVKEGYYCADAHLSSSLIQVTGSMTQVYNLKDVVATVDVSGRSNTFTADCELVAYDDKGKEIDLKKLSFSQSTVAVTVTICPTKLVQINAVIEGEPAPGYYVEKIEYAPQTARIAADEQLLREIGELTVPCDVTDATDNIDVQISLSDYLAQTYGDCYAVDGAAYVGIIATVKPAVERTLTVTASDIIGVNYYEDLTYEIYSTTESSVKVKGPGEIVDKLEVSDLKLYVDLTGCGEGTYSCEIKSATEEMIEVEGSTVMVRLALKK